MQAAGWEFPPAAWYNGTVKLERRKAEIVAVLIITEKFKTAKPFADIIGANVRHITNNKGSIGYFETPDGYTLPQGVDVHCEPGEPILVSWCAGHLCGLDMPDSYDPKYKRWNMDDLPIIPDQWKYHVMTTEPAKSQFKALKELLDRDDVTTVYHAADADREGQLLLNLVLKVARASSKKTYYRLWYTNTTPAALKRSLSDAKPLADYKPLSEAADCRQKLDWIVGLNYTRLYTTRYHSTQNVGRVVSPTLALIVNRQAEIDNFVSEDYAIISVPCKNADGEFKAEAKFTDIPFAEGFAKTLKGKDAVIENVEKTTENENRKLFNTTQLQAEASKRFGYEPDATMKIMQDLYDSGYITYPRTKSNMINPDQVEETKPLPKMTWEKVFASPSHCSPDDFDINRIVGQKGKGAEEASHTGLCPTDQGILSYQSKIKGNEKQRNIFLLIASRLVCAVLPPRVLDKTKVAVKIEGQDFKATGSVEVSPGFFNFERYVNSALKEKKTRKKAEEQTLPDMKVGDVYTCGTAKCTQKKTAPPKQYTTAQLISTMENVSRLVEDKKLKEMLKDAGLGTAASRDTIIATIKKNGFVEVKAGRLYPTEKAKTLIGMLPDEIKSPIFTAKMELALDEIARGDGDAKAFMNQIHATVRNQIDEVRKLPPVPDTERYKDNKTFVAGACPKCGADVVETEKSMVCRHNCGFIVWRSVAKKKLTKEVLKTLITNGCSDGKVEGFKSKAGKDFSCWLYIDDEYKVSFDFDDAGRKAKNNIVQKKKQSPED